MARAARVEGIVVLEIVVSTEGVVRSYRDLSGSPLLMEAANEAVKSSRYRPYIVDGEPTPFKTTTRVSFSLSAVPSSSNAEQKAQQEYVDLRNRCASQLRRRDWKQAESTCRRLAEKKESDGFHWLYDDWIGTALLGQQHPSEALSYFNKALELTPTTSSTGIELGYACRMVAIGYHSTKDIERAREFYLKAEDKIKAAIQKTANPSIQQEFGRVLQATLRLHELADRNASSTDVNKEIEKQLGLGLW